MSYFFSNQEQEEPNGSAPKNEPPSTLEDYEPPAPGDMPNVEGNEPAQGEDVQEPEPHLSRKLSRSP